MKIRTAILTKSSAIGVSPSKFGVELFGKRAVMIAREMAAEGLIELKDSTEFGRIGHKADGSWKYGVVYQALVVG